MVARYILGITLLLILTIIIVGIILHKKDNSASNGELNSPQNKPATNKKNPQTTAPSHKEFLEKKHREWSEALDEIPREKIILSDEIIKKRNMSDLEINFTNITRRTNFDKFFPIVVIDIETTGLNKRSDEIIEVSAIKFDKNFNEISCYTTLCKPKKQIPDEVSELTHITDNMVEGCPMFYQVAKDFEKYISGCNVVGHNLKFDMQFLFVNGVDFDSSVKYYDTLELAKHTLKAPGWYRRENAYDNDGILDEEYDVENYKLGTLCEYYGVYPGGAHRSLSDCYATGILLGHLIESKVDKHLY